MRAYSFKRGHQKGIDEIEDIMGKIFGNVKREENKLISSYKGLERIEVWLEGKNMMAETKSKKVNTEDSMDTIKKWNEFLFRVTGYTAKERKKKITK